MTLPAEPRDGAFVTYLAQIEKRQMQELTRQHILRWPQSERAQVRPAAPASGAGRASRTYVAPRHAAAPRVPPAGHSVAPSLLSAAIIMLLGMASFLDGAASSDDAGLIVIAAVLIWLGARRLARRTATATPR